MTRILRNNQPGKPTHTIMLKRGLGPRFRTLRERLQIDGDLIESLCSKPFVVPSVTSISTFLRSCCEVSKDRDFIVLINVKAFSPFDLYSKAQNAFGKNIAMCALACRYVLEAKFVSILENTKPAEIPVVDEDPIRPAFGDGIHDGVFPLLMCSRTARAALVEFFEGAKVKLDAYWADSETLKKRKLVSVDSMAEVISHAFGILGDEINAVQTRAACYSESALTLLAHWLEDDERDEQEKSVLLANSGTVKSLLKYSNVCEDIETFTWTPYLQEQSLAAHVDGAKKLLEEVEASLGKKDCRYELWGRAEHEAIYETRSVETPNQSNYESIKVTRFYTDPVVDPACAKIQPSIADDTQVSEYYVRFLGNECISAISETTSGLRRVTDSPMFMRSIRENVKVINGWQIQLDAVYSIAVANRIVFHTALILADQLYLSQLGARIEFYVKSSSYYALDASWNVKETPEFVKAGSPVEALIGHDFGVNGKHTMYKSKSALAAMGTQQCRLSAEDLDRFVDAKPVTDGWRIVPGLGIRPSLLERPLFTANLITTSQVEKPVPMCVSYFLPKELQVEAGVIAEISDSNKATLVALAHDLGSLVDAGFDTATESSWLAVYKVLRKVARARSSSIAQQFTHFMAGGSQFDDYDSVMVDGETDVSIHNSLKVLAAAVAYFHPACGLAIENFVSACWTPGTLTLDQRIMEG